MQQIDDRELLSRYRVTRSPDVLGELYRRHFDWLRRICYRRLRHAALAQDMAQDVFLKLAEHPPDLQRVSLRPWLTMVAWRVMIRRRDHEALLRRTNRAAAPAHPEYSHEKHNADDRQAFAYFARLTRAEQRIIRLHILQGRTLRVTGRRLGISADAAEHRYARAMAHLRRLFLRRRTLP